MQENAYFEARVAAGGCELAGRRLRLLAQLLLEHGQRVDSRHLQMYVDSCAELGIIRIDFSGKRASLPSR